MKRYFNFWLLSSGMSSQVAFSSRFGAVTFILGKLLRLIFFSLFIFLLISKTNTIAGYSLWQIIFFYLTFNLIDSISQFFLRNVYNFRDDVVSGNFDYTLTKPFSPLFRSLFGGSDILDIPTIVILIIFILLTIGKVGIAGIIGLIMYLILIFNGLLIVLSFHIFVLGVGVLTTEIDNTVMLYRDLSQMARFPVDVYKEPVKSLLTFVIPLGIMMTFPVKALLGLLSIQSIFIAFIFSFVLLFLSYRFWYFAIRRYSSASS